MKVFENLDREQAGMYRWMRSELTFEFLSHLTGVGVEVGSGLDVDRALRSAYERYVSHGAAASAGDRSKLRSGLLPPALGAALAAYTAAVEDAATFQEGLGGLLYNDVERAKVEALQILCNEIAKIR